MQFLKQQFFEIDGPTWLVACVLYGAWILLVWYNAILPWWVIMPVGAYLLAWHFSLQHEAIHSFRGVPAWLRFAVVFRPRLAVAVRALVVRVIALAEALLRSPSLDQRPDYGQLYRIHLGLRLLIH